MGFIGEEKLGFIMIFWGGFVIAWRGEGPFARLWEHAYLAGGIVCSRLSASRSHRKVTVCTPRRRGPTFVRAKVGKTRLGLCPKTPLTLKLRLDTNWTFQQMLKSRSVRRRRYALKVPAAHFILDFAGTELKINLISVV